MTVRSGTLARMCPLFHGVYLNDLVHCDKILPRTDVKIMDAGEWLGKARARDRCWDHIHIHIQSVKLDVRLMGDFKLPHTRGKICASDLPGFWVVGFFNPTGTEQRKRIRGTRL